MEENPEEVEETTEAPAAEDLTDEEIEEVAEGETQDAEHRYDEFEDLRGRLESIDTRLTELISTVGSLVINGTAELKETETIEAPKVDAFDVDEMDFTL